jgi:cell division septum initiation protein DivIVA
MTDPATAREALIVEAIGDVARLLREVEALAPALEEACQALQQANASLRDELAGFESRMASITENAKTQTIKYMAARAEEAARRSIGQQSQAMADAARVAFGVEVGATMQRLQATLQPLIERRGPRWEPWLTHAAAAAVASAATWVLAFYVGPR